MKNRVSINIITVILSIISAFFIIGFSLDIMWEAFHIKFDKSLLILGFLSYISSIFMLKGKEPRSFVKYLGIIFYISSVFMFYLNMNSHPLFDRTLDEKLLEKVELFVILLLQIFFYFSIKGFYNRVLASFFAIYTISNLLYTFGLIQFEVAMLLAILLFSFKRYRDIAYGVTTVMFLNTFTYYQPYNILHFGRAYLIDYNFAYIALVLVIFLAIYFAIDVLKRKELFGANKYTAISLIGVVFSVVLFYFQPAIAVSIFLVIFWFYAKSSILMVASFLIFGFHLYKYYYILNSTLLEKSYYLLASAAAMFALKFIIDKGFKDA